MNEREKFQAICFYLIKQCLETDAKTMTINQENVSYEGNEIGNWEIIVRKV